MKKLAVLLPSYNAASYVEESIESILNQTFPDFDLYVYDDCSTDNTAEVVSKYTDSRVFYRKNESNLGIAKTLNKGLETLLPHYEYIARMDADDWSYPERFQKQLDYLQEHPEVVLCGTQGYWIKDITQHPISAWEYPVSHQYIKPYLLFSASFGHSSVVFRAVFFKKHDFRYNETIRTCEDWDLWIRISRIGKVVNLSDFLMKYQILDNSNHRAPEKMKLHLEERSIIISEYWKDFNVVLSSKQIFDFYYNDKRIAKSEFLSTCSIVIRAFNHLYDDAENSITVVEKKRFTYMMSRKILNYWKRSQVSRVDPVIWWSIIKEVTFVNKLKLIKSIIR
jgi:glycosyltransferase involved in cell wall biosynthesis